MKTITVALVGNPNSGKSTLFNNLTGSHQHVGNYPGVTVERKEGFYRTGEYQIKVIDLPGTYSLTTYSAEELITRNYIINEKPDVVVDIIDSSNLERNLYLTVQLLELGSPLVLAFNMTDMAKSRGYQYDTQLLSEYFQSPVVETIGHKNIGKNELVQSIIQVYSQKNEYKDNESDLISLIYGPEVELELNKLASITQDIGVSSPVSNTRWLSIKLLEKDKSVLEEYNSPELLSEVNKSASLLIKRLKDSPEIAFTNIRYEFISKICMKAVRSTIEEDITSSDKIDSVVTHRFWGIPIFLGLMYLVFQVTFTLGEAPMGWIENLFGWLSGYIQGFWPDNSYSLIRSLLLDGVIGGVGGVLVFLPNILLLFLAIAILEDSGYMARAAFIMDRIMNKFGLHGKSFIPMLIGFGCSVPAIMATRTLENKKDRLITMLIIPLMSCGARLPIYAMIIPAFFPKMWHAPLLWILYLTGVLLALISAKILRVTFFKSDAVPFIMELPPYRIPTLKGIMIHMWDRGWLYLKKAGTLILGISILLWTMTNFPKLPPSLSDKYETRRVAIQQMDFLEVQQKNQLVAIDNQEAEEALNYSVAGRIGHLLVPVLKPMGFDWKIGTALIGAFAAKEVFVSQMGIIYSIGNSDESSEFLRDRLKKQYSPLVGFCIMLFCLISAPCMATIAITKNESGSWKWAMFQLLGLTMLAFVITTAVYQIGTLLNIGTIV